MRLGHDDVSSLKIECQPRKRCHNIPRVRNPGAWISTQSFFSLPFIRLSRFPVFENARRERPSGIFVFIFIACVCSS